MTLTHESVVMGIAQVQADYGCTELEAITKMQSAAAAVGDEAALEVLCEIKSAVLDPIHFGYSIGPVKRLLCSCCGSVTRGRQWHNRDTGWGLCADCIEFCHRKETPEQFRRLYGDRGIHYDVPPACPQEQSKR